MVLAEEIIFFNNNQQKLANAYPHCFLIIKGQRVFGGFSSIIEAYTSALDQFEIGTFLVIKTLPVIQQTGKPKMLVRPSFFRSLLHGFIPAKRQAAWQ
ncbi:hypothetical protein [Adhaeribacter pallidiroseus]|uniref:DUF5678 domain-containing protein n=1 Tax=Adhaeribacter pallidiroseus TaxID=2072847 RepID=A0A369QMJ1_9BACT|nr:hypothetical protein [Adhaeribacter pallidiroseus]RDC65954.1 hypothetical protein AHMF7616_04585 [Adhaeribacter pallidiroseus]